MPYRSPGSPEKSRPNYLTGKPIRYYRPRGSADIAHLIDEGFQAFNAARLGEACRIYADRKSTRLNSSHSQISYAVFCLKKKKKKKKINNTQIIYNQAQTIYTN